MRQMKPEATIGRIERKALPLTRALPPPPKSGTVYTPRELATAVVSALQPAQGLTWLEPCIGDGALLQALNDAGVKPDCVTGLDLEETESNADRFCRRPVLRGSDFLDWAQKTPTRFDRIVANPPYVPLSKIPPQLLHTALQIKDPDDKPVRKGANYWFAFLCASLKLLNPGGSLAFILPAAWDYADYAEPVRRRLVDLFGRVEVHRCNKPLFNSVNDGCVVLIARQFGVAGKRLERYDHESSQHLIRKLFATAQQPEELPAATQHPVVPMDGKGKRLGDIIDLKLGGVTGDASYFLLTETQRKEHNLPKTAFVRVLSRAWHIESGHVTLAHWKTLKADDERVWLFRPDGDALRHPDVEKYRKRGENGDCNKQAFKIKNRDPWYITPMPEKVHGFMTGMSRHGIWCCLNEMKGLNATNTLYVVTFKHASTLDERAAWSMALLTTSVQKSLPALVKLGRRRQYPDGLLKFEPGDLLELRIPEPTRTQGAHERYLEATRRLIAGDTVGAGSIADEWFANGASAPISPAD